MAAHIQARESLEEEGAETGVPQALRRGFLISNSQSDDPRLSENRGLGSQFLSNAQANQDHSSSSDGLGEPAMDFFKDLDEINTTRLGGNHALPNRPSDENMEKSQGSSYLSLLPTCNENQRDYDMQLLRTSYTPLPANDHTTNNADSAPASSANVPDNKATPRKVETGPVECPECGVQFRRRSDLKYEFPVVHGESRSMLTYQQ